MGSKYDMFWLGKIQELNSLVLYCDKAPTIEVAGIGAVGNRKSWSGKVEVGKYKGPQSEQAHMRSLGHIMKANGLFDRHPNCVFVFSLSSDGRVLTCKKKKEQEKKLQPVKAKKDKKKLSFGLPENVMLAIDFIDNLRWEDDYNYLYRWRNATALYNKMDARKRVLVHLIAYLSNAMVDANSVWTYFMPSASRMVDEYSKLDSQGQINSLVDRYSDKIAGGLGKRQSLNAIKTALCRLKDQYGGDLLVFIDWAIKNSRKGENLFKILEREFFSLIGAQFSKRIRCVIRDYKKWGVFREIPAYFSENGRLIWQEKFKVEQLRLPVDSQVTKALRNLSGGEVSSELAGDLPEKFDILWQIGRDICGAEDVKKIPKQCDICLFGGAKIFDYAPCPLRTIAVMRFMRCSSGPANVQALTQFGM